MIDGNYADLEKLLDAGKAPPSTVQIGKQIADQERLKALLESAYQYALKKGVESEMNGFNNTLRDELVQRNLDAIYNFTPLMLNDRVVPPVITEVRDVIQNNNSSIKTTGVIYKIEKQAYFSTLAPNWRTYLNIPKNQYTIDYPDALSKEFMPKNNSEYAAWKAATTSGFKEGLKVAQQLFTNNLNRLNRDYIGMIRFHEFVMQGKITMPSLSRTDIAISNTGQSLSIDQKYLVIKNLPSFEGNMLKWSTWQNQNLNGNTLSSGSQADLINNSQ